MKTTIQVDGLKELEDALKELPKATGKNVIRRALTKAAQPMINDAKAYAPVRTGKLRDSIMASKIKFSTGLAGKRAFAEAMKSGATRFEAAQAAEAANLEASGGTGEKVTSGVMVWGPTREAFYGWFQEFGTPHNGPHPFMRPAWVSNKDSAVGLIKDALWDEIKKAAERIARKAAREAQKM